METQLLYLFTRTPLHVGAGASVGAIDQPIKRERHTGLPIVPGSTLKGVFADGWTRLDEEPSLDAKGNPKVDPAGNPQVEWVGRRTPEGDWLFGRDGANGFAAGALQFGEARLLAFPVRSAGGAFAWLTSPLLLRRARRDGALSLSAADLNALQTGLQDDTALFDPLGLLALGTSRDGVVLEEYAFRLARETAGSATEKKAANDAADAALGKLTIALRRLIPDEPVLDEIHRRTVVVSDNLMSFFAMTACEVAQHVRIEDATGTADHGGLFNQENVPAETLFYATIHVLDERAKSGTTGSRRNAAAALTAFRNEVKDRSLRQIGADGSTGLGYCTVYLPPPLPSPSIGGTGNAQPGTGKSTASQPTP